MVRKDLVIVLAVELLLSDFFEASSSLYQLLGFATVICTFDSHGYGVFGFKVVGALSFVVMAFLDRESSVLFFSSGCGILGSDEYSQNSNLGFCNSESLENPGIPKF